MKKTKICYVGNKECTDKQAINKIRKVLSNKAPEDVSKDFYDMKSIISDFDNSYKLLLAAKVLDWKKDYTPPVFILGLQTMSANSMLHTLSLFIDLINDFGSGYSKESHESFKNFINLSLDDLYKRKGGEIK